MSADTTTSSPTVATRNRSATSASPAYLVLKAMGSLKITVTMFVLAMLIVLVGTLAQDEMDLAEVKREFFTSWIARVPFDIFMPITLFPHDVPALWGLGFYFPGGATIGLILLVNLIAAKTTRFSVTGKGTKLYGGIVLAILGGLLVTAVIVSGHAIEGLQGQPPISYDALWTLMKGSLAVLTAFLVGYAFMAKLPKLAQILTWGAALVAFLLTLLLIFGGDATRLDNPGLRIVWQLLQATVASSVLLVGLWLVFGKRGGNVLIHIGVGLLMVGQFVFGDRQIEQRMALAEGKSTNLIFIEDELEIAIVDPSDPELDKVYSIPEALIRKADRTGDVIDNDELPVNVRIVDWMRNSALVPAMPDRKNPADLGTGLTRIALEKKPLGAAVMDDRNMSSAYIELISKKTNKPIGTVLLSQELNDKAQLYSGMLKDEYEMVDIDGQQYEIGLRFKQVHKPYDVYLEDVERVNYSGTGRARDYSSRLVITNREDGSTQKGKTWMNNPVRYRGETFYQSRYNVFPTEDGGEIETTGLQVVKNMGWVIPYVSCMMVFVGMFAHFGGTFLVFAGRYGRQVSKDGDLLADAVNDTFSGTGKVPVWARIGIAALSLLICGVFAYGMARPKKYSSSEVDWSAVGSLPVQHEGRIKPFDTVARNLLQEIGEPLFGFTPIPKDGDGNKREPSEWLLGLIADEPWIEQCQIIRVYSPEVRGFFDLPPRYGYRYSRGELRPKLDEFREQEIRKLVDKDPDNFTRRETQIAKLSRKLNTLDLVKFSYKPPPIPQRPPNTAPEQVQEEYFANLGQLARRSQSMTKADPPALLPPTGEVSEKNLIDADWETLDSSVVSLVISRTLGENAEPIPALEPFLNLLDAVRLEKPRDVNRAVDKYKDLIADTPLAIHYDSKVRAEQWLNKFNPTLQSVALYLGAMVVGLCGFLFRAHTFRSATFWLLVGVFVIHTIAIVARIYVSGRAPVINLYSSAVFIGWASVLFCLVLEVLFPLGLANLVGALIGASTISVARFLDTSDTLHQLEAVLDTQFWLSTHVITVTLGYAATFFAGGMAIVALIHRMVCRYDSYPTGNRPADSESFQKVLYSMTYGTVCFAIFFSFIGTVLGGLWADDSWGRFWGWDPKENGALLIVLWNAVLLHARWDKMVGPRGFALLAVLGNIVTAWSWFGTNQLGIGLHSYGFTTGVLAALIVFVIANLLFVGVAYAITRALGAGLRNS